MARMDSIYLNNLVNKSISDFQDALNPLVAKQMQQQQQEWEDKRKGSQIADLYKANTADMLGDSFFNNADNDRKLADNTRTFLNQQNINQSLNNSSQQKSVNEILEDLGGVDKVLQNGFNNQNSLANYIKEYNPVGAGELIYGKGYQNKENQGFNINPASSVADYYKSPYSDKLNGRLQKASNNIADTLKYSQDTQNNFWDEQYKMLNDLGVKFDNYTVNPIYAENGVEDFRQNPLTKQQNRYAELAQNGNTLAGEHIYNTMYPKMNLRERQYISPDGKTKVNEELLYNISPNGKYSETVLNKTESPYISEKDLEDLKYRRELGLLKAKAKYDGIGKEDLYRLTPNQLADDLNEKNVTDPILRSALAFVNEHGTQADYNMLRQYNPNIKPVENTFLGKFTGKNNKEHNKYNEQVKTNQEVKDYYNIHHGGFDFIENPLNEEDIEKFNKLGIKLEPTDKLNIIRYIDTENDFIDLLPISKVRELAEKKALIKQ